MATHHSPASDEQRRSPRGPKSRGCDCLIAKLAATSCLSSLDEQALREMCSNVRQVRAKRDIIREGDKPEHVHVMLKGWAARYKVLPDGSRQIMAFLIPGDFCDLHVTILSEMDHGIVAITPAEVAFVPRAVMENLPLERPALARALWRATLIDEAVLRSWIVSLGRRDAQTRIAHLFCELYARLALVGLAADGQFESPLTQEVMADATGLTPVHVNRMLQQLRADNLILLKGRHVTIPDLSALAKVAGFDPNYLHRERLARLR